MFDSMTDKLNENVKTEKNLIENVRNTIFKAYETNEKLQKDSNNDNSSLNESLNKCKKEADDCKDDYHENNRKLNLKIESLKKEINRLYK